MQYKKNIIAGIVLVVLFFSCKKDWKDHYTTVEKTVNENVWDAVQKDGNLSVFVQYVKKYRYDTLFLTDHPYTLFIPNNDAFANFVDSGKNTQLLLDYLISEYFMQSGVVQGTRKIQTLGEKYALFERNNTGSFLDGIPLKLESPLYLNGKYFIMDQIAFPKFNLYEYFAAYNPILQKYIDSKDSMILDKSKSRPIGFDAKGNTIYDTVAIKFNLFEEKYFPVSKESRYKTATFVFPKEEDYNNGLTLMAQALGGNYHDYHDIPLDWQNKILIPYLLERGIFANMLEPNEFVLKPKPDTLKLMNILGDSVAIDYQVGTKTICSNGYAYNYANFKVADTLYTARIRFETEHLVRNIGVGRYAWLPGVSVSSNSYAPEQDYIPGASMDSVLTVYLPTKYAGTYSVEFNVDNLFPRKYLMVIRTNMYVGGIYNIYVNDVLVKTFDLYNDPIWGASDGPYYRSVTGKFVKPKGKYNSFDCWVQNILTEYGKAKIKFVYTGPAVDPAGKITFSSGLSLDYLEFIPY